MKKILFLFIILFEVFFLAPLAYSYSIRISQIDKSKFPEIQLYISFTDSSGNPVQSLSAENFLVKEEGKEVKIQKFFGSNLEQPITTILVIDRSGSMEGNKLTSAKYAAITFINLLREQDESGIISFSDSIDKTQITNNKTVLTNKIISLQAGGKTAFYDATYEALQMLEPIKGRKSIIALTDGMDNKSRYTASKVITKAKELNIPIYTIGLGTKGTQTNEGIDEECLKKIAEDTGGSYFYAPTYEELKELYIKILNQIMNEYYISYTSVRPTLDGTRRNVEITINYQGVMNITRGTYSVSGIIGKPSFKNIWLIFFTFLSFLLFLLYLPKILLLKKKSTIPETERVVKSQKVIDEKVLSTSKVPENKESEVVKKTSEEPQKSPTSRVIAKLISLDKPSLGWFNIDKEVITIGSDNNNDIVLKSPQISPKHALIKFNEGVLKIIDLNSESGTYIKIAEKNVKISESILKDGNVIILGNLTFQVKVLKI